VPQFPPLILVGEKRDELVCLEGHLRLTAYALAGFPVDVECLVGTAPTMGRWTLLRNAIDDRFGCSQESAGGSGAWVSSPRR
jgi:hypothetical protein